MRTPDDSLRVPIYDRLVEEYGDALSQARRAAEQVEQQSAEALDWSTLHGAEERGTAPPEAAEVLERLAPEPNQPEPVESEPTAPEPAEVPEPGATPYEPDPRRVRV